MNAQILVQRAALINREGIANLTVGNGTHAHACFKQVLEIMGHITSSPDLVPEESNVPQSGLKSLSPVALPNMQSESFFICCYGMLFSPEENQVVSQMDITIYSAAAIFNMAQTYLQRAIVLRTTSLFRTAGRMFDQCLQIVRSLSSPYGDIDTLRIAIMNNRSYICFELEEFEKAEETMEAIRKVSRRLVSTGSTSSVLPQGVFDEITLNVLTTACRPSTAPCA